MGRGAVRGAGREPEEGVPGGAAKRGRGPGEGSGGGGAGLARGGGPPATAYPRQARAGCCTGAARRPTQRPTGPRSRPWRAAKAWGRPGPGDTRLTASECGRGNTKASGAAALASRLRHAGVTLAGSADCARRMGRSQAAGKQPAQTGPVGGAGGAELVSLDVTNRKVWLEEKERRGFSGSQSRADQSDGGSGRGCTPRKRGGVDEPCVTGCGVWARVERGAGPAREGKQRRLALTWVWGGAGESRRHPLASSGVK